MLKVELCEKCNKYPKFQHNGKVYKLCAVCGWKALMALLGYSDDEIKISEVLSYVPYDERDH